MHSFYQSDFSDLAPQVLMLSDLPSSLIPHVIFRTFCSMLQPFNAGEVIYSATDFSILHMHWNRAELKTEVSADSLRRCVYQCNGFMFFMVCNTEYLRLFGIAVLRI